MSSVKKIPSEMEVAPRYKLFYTVSTVYTTYTVTVYIDDLSIDDWSSILRSSILSVSTIYIGDPI